MLNNTICGSLGFCTFVLGIIIQFDERNTLKNGPDVLFWGQQIDKKIEEPLTYIKKCLVHEV